MPLFDEADLREALSELSQRLAAKGVHARIYIAGGAAMALAHTHGRTTRFIDASFEDGYGDVIPLVREIAAERGWPRSWLNDQATPYMPPEHERRGDTVFESTHLTVVAASAEHLLAMKTRSARRTDESDVACLAEHVGVRSAAQAEALFESVFPDERLGARQRAWLTAVLTAAQPPDTDADDTSDQ